MPITPLQEAAMQETYDDVVRMLYKIAINAAPNLHNAHLNPVEAFDEAFALANQGFMDAYSSFTPGVGVKFSTWCYLRALRTIQEAVRQRPRLMTVPLENVREPTTTTIPIFHAEEFLLSLSGRAQIAVEAILHPPSTLRDEAETNGGAPHNYRASLKRYLRKTCGWTLQQCLETFQEIGGALKC